MTYLIGARVGPTLVIISDTRVTYTSGERTTGENVALKTGVLFPGCIFGREGNASSSGDFLTTVQKLVSPDAPVGENWERFSRCAHAYSFSREAKEQFRLLLASRNGGLPRMWMLDSVNGLVQVPADEALVTLGSGKDILDDYVQNECMPLLQATVVTPKQRVLVGPYLLCLKLIEKTQSLERPQLEQHGVGGVFHFVYQTRAREGRQAPALYVLSDLDPSRRIAYGWMFRIAYVGSILVVESLTPPGQITPGDPGRRDSIALADSTSGETPSDIGSLQHQKRIREALDA